MRIAFAVTLCLMARLAAAEDASIPVFKLEGTPGSEKHDFAAQKKSFATRLLRKDKAPVAYSDFTPPADTQVLRYPSNGGHYFAWLRMPAGSEGKKVPVVVYFHPSFLLGKSDLTDCQPFVDAGFAVLCPTVRGENGNPGHYELLCGEADDARNAIEWIAKNPRIDSKRIYTFGHGIGGGISALMSLYRILPVRLTGSSGGVYPAEALHAWEKEMQLIPYDLGNPRETELRLLASNLNKMVRPHVTIIGRKDNLMLKAGKTLQAEVDQLKAPLTFAVVEGDHENSLPAALKLFCAIIQKDLELP